MLGIITQLGLITTGILCLMICAMTAYNTVGSTILGKLWIGVNLSLALWAIPWCIGAFYLRTDEARWLSIYLASLCAMVLPPLFLCFTYSLVNRKIKGSRFIRLSWVLTGILIVACAAFPHHLFTVGVRKVRDAYLPKGGFLLWVFAIQYSILFARAIYLLVRELNHLHGSQKNKILYVIIGVAIGSSGGITTFLTPLGIYPYGVVFVPCYSILITYAITKYRLMDITFVIRKTLVYSVVAASLITAYLAIVTLFARIFAAFTGGSNIFSSAVAAALISFCAQPLRKRVQNFVDTKFFRQYVDREEKLYELSREVITHTTPEAMGEALMRVITEALHPKSGALYLRATDQNGFVRASSPVSASLPERMEDDNVLTNYFKDHPQPFVHDTSSDSGSSRNTRNKGGREDAA